MPRTPAGNLASLHLDGWTLLLLFGAVMACLLIFTIVNDLLEGGPIHGDKPWQSNEYRKVQAPRNGIEPIDRTVAQHADQAQQAEWEETQRDKRWWRPRRWF